MIYFSFGSKKDVPYSQALRLNKICSNNEFFDKRCNDLEKYLLERGYSEKMVRKYFELEPFPEMHFYRKLITRRSRTK